MTDSREKSEMTPSVPDIFGTMVFSDVVMKERLPENIYAAVAEAIAESKPLHRADANIVASVMKDWAVEKGATHFTHWFQPMTGMTAEKHDSFIAPDGRGRAIMEFSGKELVKGESDASSFPSGGIRATFEARGYTAWDPSSSAFIKDNTLYIPTAFCSYSGEALDKKTPLLRSMEAIDRQAVRMLRLLGDKEVRHVVTTAGPEQEYFLVDKKLYDARPDLFLCGRTLLGSRPPKGQEMDDHYYGSIKPRVAAFMRELDIELWKLGICAKTEHNEAAPAQHELAPIYTSVNVAADQNQLVMDMMKIVAAKHGLACLLHEKPFAGVNGNGKHNNWSLQTESGENLLSPGTAPSKNIRFLIFVAAVIEAVDLHQDLLRISVASAGNDHRLGGNEAPPSIVSMFLGDEITDILGAIADRREYSERDKVQMDVGVSVLPHFSKDKTDRNRTSPFAFTGNKFEFRMPGSSFSISGPNIVLNTIVADVLEGFCADLESRPEEEREAAAFDLVAKTYTEHARIIFNGNNYSEEWVAEAHRRGLLDLRTTVDALAYYPSEKNIALFERQGVFSETEIRSRCEILLENYEKTVNIEALTMAQMVRGDVLPSALAYQKELASLAVKKKELGISAGTEIDLLSEVSRLTDQLVSGLETLEEGCEQVSSTGECGTVARSTFYRDRIINDMEALRRIADRLEEVTPRTFRTLTTYTDLLYSV